MDPVSQLVSALIGMGTGGIIGAIFFILYLREDKRNEELTEKLLTLTTNVVSTAKDLTAAVEAALKYRDRP
jgi:gas vesicle protein